MLQWSLFVIGHLKSKKDSRPPIYKKNDGGGVDYNKLTYVIMLCILRRSTWSPINLHSTRHSIATPLMVYRREG
jgi:hypothetical protein